MGKIIAKVLQYLGIGLIGLAAVSLAANNLIEAVKTHYEGLPADVIAYLHLAGMDTGLQLILSAYASSLAIAGGKKLGFIS